MSAEEQYELPERWVRADTENIEIYHRISLITNEPIVRVFRLHTAAARNLPWFICRHGLAGWMQGKRFNEELKPVPEMLRDAEAWYIDKLRRQIEVLHAEIGRGEEWQN